ncbi:alginate export family protein [Persicitalea jodogahamensis]|uniref:Alginate export domain-containing protein n=1 Tax=Persicitalea jodogahamensis TaxID=402147 RepID=A0A8J3D6W5_9BACT|nr:alginate export family protein [Persicitalea jodogahamensis]GHB59053.1 hypothetical protein GCM10007390_10880 [Persicitalea jodogahamensis]
MKKFIKTLGLFVALLGIMPARVKAQMVLSGQVRTRTELRDGFARPLTESQDAALFTSQRTRLNVDYEKDRIKFFVTVQDVRVWGQDASTNNGVTNPTLDGLMVHQAWAEIGLLDTANTTTGRNLSLKIGRQELLYDDSRLLGNLDWLQQARRHDAVVLKYERNGFSAHLGAAYNQNRESLTGQIYNGVPTGYAAGTNGIGTSYKSLQFLHLGKKLKQGMASFLIVKDDFNRYSPDSLGAKVWQKGTWNRVTLGPYVSTKIGKNLSLAASAYLQTGKNKDGNVLNASTASVSAIYEVSRNFAFGPGADYLSGNAPGDSRSHRFDPLYGTPHKFWGQMDYFYVADGFGPGGLLNYYLKSAFTLTPKLSGTADYHVFQSPNEIQVGDKSLASKSFGSEFDLILNYKMMPDVAIQLGYAHYFSRPTLAAVKGVANAREGANWAYLMINITPQFLTK